MQFFSTYQNHITFERCEGKRMYAEIQYDIDYSARKIYYHDLNYMAMCVYTAQMNRKICETKCRLGI